MLFRSSALLLCLVQGCAEAPPPPPKMATVTASNDQSATCTGDTTVVGGGYEIEPSARVTGKIPIVVANRPTENGWRVECVDGEGKTVTSCKAYVVCATVLR